MELSGRALVTGGAGFVGSSLSAFLKRDYPNLEVIALDNLSRRGSELNLARIVKDGVRFHHVVEDFGFKDKEAPIDPAAFCLRFFRKACNFVAVQFYGAESGLRANRCDGREFTVRSMKRDESFDVHVR